MSMRNPDFTTLRAIAFAALAAAMLSAPIEAAGPTISGAWFRALPAHLPAGGYFSLKNDTGKTISLVGAGSPACGMLMLHKSERVGGMERMTDVASIDVAPHATLKFAPGGYHLMCMEPGPAMIPGGRVPVTLSFADGTSLSARFDIRSAAGK